MAAARPSGPHPSPSPPGPGLPQRHRAGGRLRPGGRGQPGGSAPHHARLKIAHAALGRALQAARKAVAALEAELERTPTRLPLAVVAPDSQVLDIESKLVTHAVRMSAYSVIRIPRRESAVGVGEGWVREGNPL